MNAATLRGVILRGRETQAGAIAERQDCLYGALPKGLNANHDRTTAILKSPRHNFGSARAPLIHKDNHWVVFGLVFDMGLIIVLSSLPGLDVDNEPIEPDKLFGDINGSGQEATRIVAQIQDQRLHLLLT